MASRSGSEEMKDDDSMLILAQVQQRAVDILKALNVESAEMDQASPEWSAGRDVVSGALAAAQRLVEATKATVEGR